MDSIESLRNIANVTHETQLIATTLMEKMRHGQNVPKMPPGGVRGFDFHGLY